MDRRGALRHPSKEHVAVGLRWMEGIQECIARGDFLNISALGALLGVDRAPAIGQMVWLRIDGEAPSDWVEATVVEVEPGQRHATSVRVTLRESCPYALFTAAVNWFTP
jgi:hypothetical protein